MRSNGSSAKKSGQPYHGMKRALGFLTIAGIMTASVISSRVFLRDLSGVYSVSIVGGGETANLHLTELPVTERGPHWLIGTWPKMYGYDQYTQHPSYFRGGVFSHRSVGYRTYTEIVLGPRYLVVPGPAWLAACASVVGLMVVISLLTVSVRWICETDEKRGDGTSP
jgi:hypothetical protein